MKLDKSTEWNWLTNENLTSILQLTMTSIMPDLKHLASAAHTQWMH
jgi:hypothetical protein